MTKITYNLGISSQAPSASTTEGSGDIDTLTFNSVDFSQDGEQTFTLTGDFDRVNGNGKIGVAFSNPSVGTLTGNPDGTFTYTVKESELQEAGFPTSVSFTATDDQGVSDTDTVTVNIHCFAEGTMIATPAGEQPVEELSIGDLVTTADGRAVPVRWIGVNRIVPYFKPAERLSPVAIAPGALGANLPNATLIVTADHGLILDGHVVNASVLVGAPGIIAVPWEAFPSGITYYHIETENHEVVLANGAPAETYIDYVGRESFDNFAEYVALYGAETIIAEMDRLRISSARQLPPELRARFGIPGETFAFDLAEVA